jgi:hypothetical protein
MALNLLEYRFAVESSELFPETLDLLLANPLQVKIPPCRPESEGELVPEHAHPDQLLALFSLSRNGTTRRRLRGNSLGTFPRVRGFYFGLLLFGGR